jgi:GNAT superfamily N-acetyltransferase
MLLADVEKVVVLGAVMHAESMLSAWPLNLERALAVLEGTLGLDTTFAYVSEEENGDITGALIGELSMHMVVDVQIATEHLFYVDPEARGGFAAVRLIDAFDTWATLVGASLISIQVDAGINNDRTMDFLHRQGFADHGVYMTREV